MSTQRNPGTPDPNHPNTLDYVASGNWFQPGCSAFQDERARTLDLVHQFNALPPAQQDRAQELLRQITCSDTNATVVGPFFVEVGKHLHLGERVFINTGATILNTAHLTIGDGTMIGPNCQLITVTHPLDREQRAAGWERAEPITLGKDVWLAAGVTVLPGVTLGDAAVAAAGAVVTKDVPPGVLVAGVPARVVREV
ncbi:maltose O-acetyltransferase [Corynebacterium renale]|uniref:sugar O-acetyltransferase n=1 Tax=Corynebacterium renale TaxID=1724 RepID=UPI000DA3A5D8|nr:sugar O-acetyltransferase [Corynebacterium renale]SQG63802.1 maltose O-acetyltransferase [Corynebacterium renale]STD02240.1 maltose O-acetyltransferase [Corynebacterium renale]